MRGDIPVKPAHPVPDRERIAQQLDPQRKTKTQNLALIRVTRNLAPQKRLKFGGISSR
jgi:hypothetical protein